MTEQRQFPVMWPLLRVTEEVYERLGCPRTIPWEVIAPHEAQAKKNHNQDLNTLARRHGMTPQELVAVLTDRYWGELVFMPHDEAIEELKRILKTCST